MRPTLDIPLARLPLCSYQRCDDGAHLLVVEDVPVTREFLKRLLMESGYRVSLAGTAGEAMAKLAQELPDLVVLDLLLPDVNGLEVCRFLRTQAGGEDIPVLIITVDERPSSHAEAVRAGADDFLRKPLLPVELQTRVRSLIRLRQMRAQLRQEREAILTLHGQKEELIQFVVHDLKNLLSTLFCSVELLDVEDPDGRQKQRQRIEDTARSMQDMVQSMLDLSVHEEAGLVPQLESITLGPWLERVHRELDPLFQRKSQTLVLEVEPGLTMTADPQMLHRVLLNLMENASKYGPIDSRIQVRAFRSGPNLRLEVADQGAGIPAAKKAVIFDRFIRLQASGNSTPGRGLGLALCRLVLQLHGGRIWVEDHEPHGSRFIMEMPASI